MPGHVDAHGFLVSPLALADAEHKIFVLYSLYTCVSLEPVQWRQRGPALPCETSFYHVVEKGCMRPRLELCHVPGHLRQ